MRNLHYLRHGRFFVLLAAKGERPFLTEEQGQLRDIRVAPLSYGGYSLRVAKGDYLKKDEPATADGKHRVRVQINRRQFTEPKAYFLDALWRRPAKQLAAEFYGLPSSPTHRFASNS